MCPIYYASFEPFTAVTAAAISCNDPLIIFFYVLSDWGTQETS